MKNETRLKYNALAEQVAKLNGVTSAAQKFDVAPSVQQTLENKIQQSSDYLKLVNIEGVDEKSGDKLGLGVSGPVAGRTDTTKGDRQPRDLSALDENGYACYQTNFDSAFPYAKLDAWAKFPDFQTRFTAMLTNQQALDRLMIGWNGTSAAAQTDITANPLLQDVNIGWLQQLRTKAGKQVLTTGKKAQGEVRVGPNGDYETLDALVFDIKQMLAPWYRNDPGLVVHVGDELMHDKYFPVINRQQTAQDELASQVLVSQKAIGGRQGMVVPFFPNGTLLLTRPDNLSIYYQNGKRRRLLIDEPKRDRVADYQSSNEAYVVENYDGAVLVENIVYGKWNKDGTVDTGDAGE